MAVFSEETRNIIWAAVHDTPAVEPRIAFSPVGPAASGGNGVDRLLTSPEILAEYFRRRPRTSRGAAESQESAEAREAQIRSLAPSELADLVWRQLFLDHSPLSESARSVLTTLGLFGVDVSSGDLREIRERFEQIPAKRRLEKSLALANLELVLYPVESVEPAGKRQPPAPPPACRPVLSLTRLLGEWKASAKKLRLLGFGVKAKVDEFVPLELRRHLAGAADRLGPAALSFDWADGPTPRHDVGRLLLEAVLPLCRERGLALLLAADASIECLAPLWETFPEVNFLLFPTRDDQMFPAGLATTRRRNLLLGGPDRPLSHPSALEGVFRRRLEESGSAFHACHSGAATPEELVGRWAHLRWTLAEALIRRYAELWRTGWRIPEAGIRQDIRAMLGGNLKEFLGLD